MAGQGCYIEEEIYLQTVLPHLDLLGTKIVDIRMLAELKNLLNLNLAHNQIVDLTPLAGLADVQWLNLDFNRQITDISPLAYYFAPRTTTPTKEQSTLSLATLNRLQGV